ncbi:putative bifunctional diguanylate cyclase/phosphodiesterase [Microvirga sp. 2MCAF38]|uniref:putative bifunctional diguanylate cyclase/phosphodiesterase n=1 Tax=Microvirga sp. 2MCAF38 TaxID=3232989 RepID=UPI003F96366E
MLVALAVVALELKMNLLVRIYFITQQFEYLHLDKIFLGFVAACIALAFIGIRRSFRLRTEIRRRIVAERQAQALARHDPVTGLPNRSKFLEEVASVIQRTKAYNASSAVLLIAIDRFKTINELYGHATGDKILAEVATRLRRVLRVGDGLARTGGDEFALMISLNFDEDIPVRLAQRMINIVTQPIYLDGAEIKVSVTVGIALFPCDAVDPDLLLHAAGLALNRAKKDGRGKYRFFEDGMDEELRSRANTEQELKSAIEDNLIKPYYQPLVLLKTGEICGFEVLARWQHPQKGLRLPADFIPIAEDTGQISALSHHLLRQACLDSKLWPNHLTLSLNIAPCQLEERNLPYEILAVLRETEFDPRRLIIEITEAALVRDMETAREILGVLKREGVRIELDDFGIGYSSLYHLRELSFDAIKIDRSFIQSFRLDDENKRVLGAIINLGHTLNLATVAEGIEDEGDLALLTELQCQFGQGYYFGMPVPVEEATLIVRKSEASTLTRV